MNDYLFGNEKYERIYNCSILSQEEWEKRKESNIIGAFYLLLATIYQFLYLPFLAVMLRRDFWIHSCYRLMFLLGVLDVVAIFVGGTLMGIFTLRGDIFCTNKDFIYISSCFNATFWTASCTVGILLMFNRFLDLINKEYAILVFGGRKTYFWMILPFVYSAYFLFFTTPFLINVKLDSLFVNPFITEVDSNGTINGTVIDPQNYANVSITVHNLSVAALFPLLYLALCGILIVKTRGGNTVNISSIQKQIIIQSIIVSANIEIASIGFVYMQLFSLSRIIIILAHFSWMTTCGASVFTYIVVNKSMRREALVMIRNFVTIDLVQRSNPRNTITPGSAQLTSNPTIMMPTTTRDS